MSNNNDFNSEVIARGIAVLESEGNAIMDMRARIGDDFVNAVKMISECQGRLVITGMGKSGSIGRKLSGTFASTGTPSFFMHPAESIHGDLGMLTADDVVLALSNSGETEEIVRILPAIARIGAKMISLVGRVQSTLAQYSEVVIDVSVNEEACPLGLAPTTSTTAALAMGDALALAVMEVRNFTSRDYALRHPGGTLGRKLLMLVSDVMRTGDAMAIVGQGSTVMDAMFAITKSGAGAACVTDDEGSLVGLVTDGDIRRAIIKDSQVLTQCVCDIMTHEPRVITPNRLATEGLRSMEYKGRLIGEIAVVENGKPVGVLMLKDLVSVGLV